MNRLQKFFSLLLIPAGIHTNSSAWYLIFDLPKTLIDVDQGSFFKSEIGFSGILYTLTFNNPGKLKEKTFRILSKLGKQDVPAEQLTRDPEGDVLPQIYCDF